MSDSIHESTETIDKMRVISIQIKALETELRELGPKQLTM